MEERGQIFTNLRRNSGPMQRKFGEIWAVRPTFAADHPKCDRLKASVERVLALAVFLLLITSNYICAAEEENDKRINISPFFFHNIEQNGAVEEIQAAGPFYSYSASPRQKSWSLRPFLSYIRDREKNIEEWQFLYPLGKYRIAAGEKRSYFLPLISGKEQDGQEKFDFFPVFWGKTRAGEKYGGVFPVYGQWKERFTRDEITFVMWPLYSTAKWEGNKKTTILWPVISWTEGPKEQAFRVWPFYGWEKRPGEYESHFYLWPVGHYSREDLNTNEPLTKKMIFPLYISETSVNRNKKIILWPFFNYYHNKLVGYKQWDLPWPFIQYARAEDYEVKKFWPLFTEKKKPNAYEFSLLWPFYQYSLEDLPEDKAVRSTYRFLLISKAQTTVWPETNEKETVGRLWPLYSLMTRRDGSEYLRFPDIIPTADEGFERNYGPIFRLYEYEKDKKGNKRSKFLWGLYRHEETGVGSLTELSFLFSRKSAPDLTRVSVLHGLFEYLRTPAFKTLKVLYIPEVFIWSAQR